MTSASSLPFAGAASGADVRPRDRMVRSAAALFARDGLRGTGLREVADHAGVSRGSIQHHFPGGKAQLTADALDWMGAAVRTVLDAAAAERTASGAQAGRVLDAFVDLWRRGLEDTGLTTGCSVSATVHDSDDPALLARTARVFADWGAPFRRALLVDGRPEDEADALATTAVAALEGAVMLCRARRDLRPLDQTAAVLRGLLAGSGRSGGR